MKPGNLFFKVLNPSVYPKDEDFYANHDVFLIKTSFFMEVFKSIGFKMKSLILSLFTIPSIYIIKAEYFFFWTFNSNSLIFISLFISKLYLIFKYSRLFFRGVWGKKVLGKKGFWLNFKEMWGMCKISV